jgi:hypothetical protein
MNMKVEQSEKGSVSGSRGKGKDTEERRGPK